MAPIVRDASPEDLEWLKYHDELLKKTGDNFITGAEKYGDIFTAINAIYIGLLTFLGAAGSGVLKINGFAGVAIILAPIVLWIFGMYFLFQVKQPLFTAYSPDSPSDIRHAVTENNIRKGRNYHRGISCFSIGILFMIFALVLGLQIATAPAPVVQPADVQLVIAGDHALSLRQVPVEMVPGTNKTVSVTLLNSAGTEYVIRLPNGDRVGINKSWVEFVVRK